MPTPDNTPNDNNVRIAPGVSVPESALDYSFARGSGPGGQNVNRRATKAALRVRIADLDLPERVRRRLKRLAGKRLIFDNPDDEAPERGEILIVASEHRTQGRNKQECLDRLRALIVEAQAVPKKRIATKPSRRAKQRRLDDKSKQAQKKERRSKSRRPRDDD